ncbi:MAG: D-amino acid dehydrogenase [Herbaspirillum sp.]
MAETKITSGKQVIVIGGGIVGLCSAYFLAMAGHQVAVLERRANVAEESSFANGGIISTGIGPWAMPDLPQKLLSFLLKPESPVMLRIGTNRELWRWLQQWLNECELAHYRNNATRMQRVTRYSQELLHQLSAHYQLDYERSNGVLQLLRTERDLALIAPARTLLAEQGIRCELLDADAARAIEPALCANTSFRAALYLPDDEAGNCALFTKQLRYIAQEVGVTFHFDATVEAIQPQSQGIALQVDGAQIHADAVVLAASAASTALLRPLQIKLPLYPVRGYSITLPIRDFDVAPQTALIDEAYKVALTRLGNRIRISGVAALGPERPNGNARALRTLEKVALDWFPGAAQYHSAALWHGTQPMLPDGAPILGATPVKNLYLNLGHGAHGWAMAPGCGKILADLISQRSPDIDLGGLTLARYK